MNPIILTYPLAGILTIVLALGLGFYLTSRFHLRWRLFWIGAAGFVLSQVGHIPFNLRVLPMLNQVDFLRNMPEQWMMPFNAVILGMSAGVFEETTRYLIYRIWVKDARSWAKGLLTGAGWGGFEAIIVAAIILYTYLQVMALRGADLPTVFSPEQLPQVEAKLEAFWSMSWFESMMGLVERAFTIPIHVFLSVLVLQSFIRRQIRWLFLAVGWHAFINAFGTIYVMQTWGIYIGEAVLGLLSLASIGMTILLRESDPEKPQLPEPEAPLPIFEIQLASESQEQIEDSRFQ
jgi:uncharacterized membrane protein YhfC